MLGTYILSVQKHILNIQLHKFLNPFYTFEVKAVKNLYNLFILENPSFVNRKSKNYVLYIHGKVLICINKFCGSH